MLEQLKEIEEIKSSDGSRLALRTDEGGEVLETRDPRGRLIFEYHPATGRAVVHVPGALDVQAEGGIRFKGRTIALEADREVEVSSADSRLRVNPDSMTLESGSVALGAKEITVTGGRARADIREVHLRAEKMEQAVGRVILAARELIERVEGAIHTRAGRFKLQSRRDVTIQAKTANLVAKDDFRVQGETIHLG